MFKLKKSRIISICVAVSITLGVTVFAKQATETISVMYDNIKILIDGVEYTAYDANGEVVEPFIYNGTTYLPVRGIANAFDKEVEWEPQTSTVVLGSKNYDWLDQMGYVDLKFSDNENDNSHYFTNWDTEQADNKGNYYKRGLKFTLCANNFFNGKDGKDKELFGETSYLLNNQYKNFMGTLTTPNYDGKLTLVVKFFGDGKEIYTSPLLSTNSYPTEFNIDVSQYKTLRILVECPRPETDWGSNSPCVGIVDARLEKK